MIQHVGIKFSFHFVNMFNTGPLYAFWMANHLTGMKPIVEY